MHTGSTAHGYGLMGPNLKMGQGTSDPDSWHSSSQDSQSHNLLLNLQAEKTVFESHWDRKKNQPQTHKTHKGWPMLFTVPLLATRWPSDCRCSPTGWGAEHSFLLSMYSQRFPGLLLATGTSCCGWTLLLTARKKPCRRYCRKPNNMRC